MKTTNPGKVIVVLSPLGADQNDIAMLATQEGAALPVDRLPESNRNRAGACANRVAAKVVRRLLKVVGSSWFDPRDIPIRWPDERQRSRLRTHLQKALSEGWPGQSTILFHDDRLCLCAELLCRELADLGWDVSVRVLIKNPDLCIARFCARTMIGEDLAQVLWVKQLIAAERISRSFPRRIVVRAAPTAPCNDEKTDPSKHTAEDRLREEIIKLLDNDTGITFDELRVVLSQAPKRKTDTEEILLSELGRCLDATDAPVPLGNPITTARSGGLRVHLIVSGGEQTRLSSAHIRLIRPLRDSILGNKLDISIGDSADSPSCDICVVQRAVFRDRKTAETLVNNLQMRNTPLVVDIDDGFPVIAADHAQANYYAERNEALEFTVAQSNELWLSTPELIQLYESGQRRCTLVPNGLDPQLWRRWKPSEKRSKYDPIRLLYMGSHTHANDFALVQPALDALWRDRPGRFVLELVGVTDVVASAPWLLVREVPKSRRSYPEFVPWLLSQGSYDIGIAPLVNTPFNRCKSDLKVLEYVALGVIPLASNLAPYRFDEQFRDCLVDDWYDKFHDVFDELQEERPLNIAQENHIWCHRSTANTACLLMDRMQKIVGS